MEVQLRAKPTPFKVCTDGERIRGVYAPIKCEYACTPATAYTRPVYTCTCSRDPLHTSLAREQKADYLGRVLRRATYVRLTSASLARSLVHALPLPSPPPLDRPRVPSLAIRSVESEVVCQIFGRSEIARVSSRSPIAARSRSECYAGITGNIGEAL